MAQEERRGACMLSPDALTHLPVLNEPQTQTILCPAPHEAAPSPVVWPGAPPLLHQQCAPWSIIFFRIYIHIQDTWVRTGAGGSGQVLRLGVSLGGPPAPPEVSNWGGWVLDGSVAPECPQSSAWHPDGTRDTEQRRAKENYHQTAMKPREILRTISRWLFGTEEGQRLANSVSLYV